MAVVSLVIDDGFAVHGVKIIDSAKGKFISMPREKYKDEYRDICHPITAEVRQEISSTIMGAYEQYLNEQNIQSQGKGAQEGANMQKSADLESEQLEQSSAYTQTM